jgi:hypothetical protein
MCTQVIFLGNILISEGNESLSVAISVNRVHAKLNN